MTTNNCERLGTSRTQRRRSGKAGQTTPSTTAHLRQPPLTPRGRRGRKLEQ